MVHIMTITFLLDFPIATREVYRATINEREVYENQEILATAHEYNNSINDYASSTARQRQE